MFYNALKKYNLKHSIYKIQILWKLDLKWIIIQCVPSFSSVQHTEDMLGMISFRNLHVPLMFVCIYIVYEKGRLIRFEKDLHLVKREPVIERCQIYLTYSTYIYLHLYISNMHTRYPYRDTYPHMYFCICTPKEI